MKCSNCGCGTGGSRYLCPVSLGIAIGLTCAIAIFRWGLYMMHYGVPANMPMVIKDVTYSGILMHSLWGLIKGFIFGLLIALIYDGIAHCCKARCCRSDGTCPCCAGGKNKMDMPSRR